MRRPARRPAIADVAGHRAGCSMGRFHRLAACDATSPADISEPGSIPAVRLSFVRVAYAAVRLSRIGR